MSRWEPVSMMPDEHVVVVRRYKHAPHDRVMYDAIVDERDRWLLLRQGEVPPEVVNAHRPDLVVFRPWLDPVVSAVELRIENIGAGPGSGSVLTVFAFATNEEFPPETRKHIRHRLGTVFGGAVREWVDH